MPRQTKLVFTVKDLEQMNPCRDALDYARTYKSPYTAWEKCERADWMIWFLRRKSLLDKPTAVTFAIMCAERVLKIFEKKYPKDKRPRAAIEAAKTWVKNPTEENRAAAYAAYAAAAAYSAAYAAAAAAAAYSAAYAAAAAAAYADADAAAYSAAYAKAAAYARSKERKWQANQLRRLVANPFKK